MALAGTARVGNSQVVRFLDSTIQRFARSGFSLAGSLIHEVDRRRGGGTRRTPAHLLIQDASGLPGPALVEPVADWNMLLLPREVDSDQLKGLARAAGKTAVEGAVGRLQDLARDLPRNVAALPGAIAAKPWRQGPDHDDAATPDFQGHPAQEAAWDRFLAAYDAVGELRAAYTLAPSDATAEELRWAEVELEDAVAIAGELEVHNIRWILA